MAFSYGQGIHARRAYDQQSNLCWLTTLFFCFFFTHHAVLVHRHAVLLQEVVHVRAEPFLSSLPEEERCAPSGLQVALDCLELKERTFGERASEDSDAQAGADEWRVYKVERSCSVVFCRLLAPLSSPPRTPVCGVRVCAF